MHRWKHLCLVAILSYSLVASLLLVVLPLHFLQISSQSFDLVLVLINLSLVHVEFWGHCFHLVGLLLQILLIDGQLLSNFRSRLPSKQVLQLDVQLLFLLYDYIFFDHFLRLLNQSFLKGLDLLEQLPGVRVSAFEFPPPMVVQRILQFFRQCFDLQPFI